MKMMIFITLFGIGSLAYWVIASAGEPPKVGNPAPAFKLYDSKQQQHQLSDYAGKWLVLYFYPKDDTPGCTKEACHFRDDLFKLEQLGAKVVGISVDNTNSHAKFAEKYQLPFPLLVDSDGNVADRYRALTNLGVVKIAKRYTFLINPQGNIAKTYLNVDTSRHSQEIIDDLSKLK